MTPPETAPVHQLVMLESMLGARVAPEGTHFNVWAPSAGRVEVVFTDHSRAALSLDSRDRGYFEGFAPQVGGGARYWYRLDGGPLLPDPASRYQPEGVHGPSEVIDPDRFEWTDNNWRGVDRDRLVIYELHIGTFSPAGTFVGASDRLAAVASLGATAIEIMPVAAFPGSRGWGYDGVDLFAPSSAYGRPDDFRRLVDTAHRLGLAVLLDVVYNHLGPDGAYLFTFAREYSTSRHRTPWGDAVNLDGPGSREVRRFFIENALRWLREYHIDGLRLDATHALVDDGAPHFVAELAREVRAFRPTAVLLAEDERRAPEITRTAASGGWGLDAMWADDFHHHVRRLLAGDHEGYFAPYSGTTEDIALTIDRGWWFRDTLGGERESAHDAQDAEGGSRRTQFVFCLQNHDQVGNRAFGHRLHHDIDAAAFRAATALLLLAPETPLLFMGQEWAASTPFLYFTDLPEPLGSQVTKGRREEFGAFTAFAEPSLRASIPDPQSAGTFEASRLNWDERTNEPHASVLRLHEALLAMRRTHPALKSSGGALLVLSLNADVIAMRCSEPSSEVVVIVRLRGEGTIAVPEEILSAAHPFRVLLTTEDAPYTTPAPIAIDVHGGSVALSFRRPGAVIFELVRPLHS